MIWRPNLPGCVLFSTVGSAQQKRLLTYPGLGFRKTVVILRHWTRERLKTRSVRFKLDGEEAAWPRGAGSLGERGKGNGCEAEEAVLAWWESLDEWAGRRGG